MATIPDWMKGTYYSPPNKTEEKKPASPTGTYYSPPNTTKQKTPTTPKAPTAPKATTTITGVSPQRDISSEIAAEVAKDKIDYNRLSQLVGESGMSTKESIDYIDSLISGKSTGNTQTETYTADAPQYPGTPAPINEVNYMEPAFNTQKYIQELIDAAKSDAGPNYQANMSEMTEAEEKEPIEIEV